MAQSPCTENIGSTLNSQTAILQAEDEAIEIYRAAALMLDNEAAALSLVESSVAQADIDPCADPCATRGVVRQRVLDGALAIMHQQDPASFAAVPASISSAACLEEDSALSPDQLSDLLSGAGRTSLRAWLSRLTQAERAVFVQRAVLGESNAATASAINRFSRASLWTPEAVASLFRQALCSLASSLVHSTNPA